MQALITNLGSTSPDQDLFLSTYKVEVKAGETVTISDVAPSDIEGDGQLKDLIANGKVSVAMELTSADSVVATKGRIGSDKLPRYTYAQLPSGALAIDGMVAFCTNGRKVGEGGGAGTGVPVYFDGASWRVFSTDAAVAI